MGINWDDTLGSVAKDLGGQLFEAAKESAKDSWDDIEEDNKEQLQMLSTLLGQLKVRELTGEDVSPLINHVDAQIANLTFVNKSAGSRAIMGFWAKAIDISTSVIVGVGKKFVGL